MSYLTIKYLHIISMVILFGVGFGSAFYKWMADRNGNVDHIAIVNHHVVIADWIFTTPTVIFQPISGLYMLHLTNISLSTTWVTQSIVLFFIAGICWLPVVFLQIKMRKMAALASEQNQPLDTKYWRYARIWFLLGIPAFTAMLLIVHLMVTKGGYNV